MELTGLDTPSTNSNNERNPQLDPVEQELWSTKLFSEQSCNAVYVRVHLSNYTLNYIEQTERGEIKHEAKSMSIKHILNAEFMGVMSTPTVLPTQITTLT